MKEAVLVPTTVLKSLVNENEICTGHFRDGSVGIVQRPEVDVVTGALVVEVTSVVLGAVEVVEVVLGAAVVVVVGCAVVGWAVAVVGCGGGLV